MKRIPSVRRGNGHGPTLPQKRMLEALAGAVSEYAVPMPRNRGLPPCYKLDVAFPEKRVGVELEGGSHRARARREQDVKKDAALAAAGWRVVRIKNADALRWVADGMPDDNVGAALAAAIWRKPHAMLSSIN